MGWLPAGIQSQKQMKRGTVDEGAALEEMIPERYNSRTELTADVKPGPNDWRYDWNRRMKRRRRFTNITPAAFSLHYRRPLTRTPNAPMANPVNASVPGSGTTTAEK
ncbi:MAG: hypothetical protein U0746_19070 [Gemmataceae bacterium]